MSALGSAPNIVIFKFCDDEEMADDPRLVPSGLGHRARNPKGRGPSINPNERHTRGAGCMKKYGYRI